MLSNNIVMKISEFLNFEAKVHEGVLENEVLDKFSNVISNAISHTFTETMKVSFESNVESFIINPRDLSSMSVENGMLISYISGENYPFLSFFLIRPQNLSILGDIVNKRQIGQRNELGELEKSIVLEVDNILQGCVINSLKDIIDQYISATIPKNITLFELKEIIKNFISQNSSNDRKAVFVKADISSGGDVFSKAILIFGQPMINSLNKMI